MIIYATIGDTLSNRLNKQGEKEFFTVEGERVISNVDIGQGEKFRDIETSIRNIWPTAVIRFEKDKKEALK